MKNRTLREIEELNNPKPIRFIGDEIIRWIFGIALGVVLEAIGHLALLGLDRVMGWTGI